MPPRRARLASIAFSTGGSAVFRLADRTASVVHRSTLPHHLLSEKVTRSDALPIVAVSVAVRDVRILPALAVKVTEVAPAGTLTEVGALRTPLLDETAIAIPPDGAPPVSVRTQLVVP